MGLMNGKAWNGMEKQHQSCTKDWGATREGMTPVIEEGVRTSRWMRDEGGRKYFPRGMRVVSLFEASKGLLVLLVGFGILAFVHQDLHEVAKELVLHFHLNPATHYPHIFLKAAKQWNDQHLWLLAGSALLYATGRFVEAYGLWRQRRWAAWFGALCGGVYVPIELFELARGVTWAKVTLLLVNVGIVGYLGYALYLTRKACADGE